MSLIKGIYAASMSVLNDDLTLNVEKTIKKLGLPKKELDLKINAVGGLPEWQPSNSPDLSFWQFFFESLCWLDHSIWRTFCYQDHDTKVLKDRQ